MKDLKALRHFGSRYRDAWGFDCIPGPFNSCIKYGIYICPSPGSYAECAPIIIRDAILS